MQIKDSHFISVNVFVYVSHKKIKKNASDCNFLNQHFSHPFVPDQYANWLRGPFLISLSLFCDKLRYHFVRMYMRGK